MSSKNGTAVVFILLILLLAAVAPALAQSKQAPAATKAKGAQTKMLQTIYFGAG
jgi:outer membrane lipoprotein-sorting protein